MDSFITMGEAMRLAAEGQQQIARALMGPEEAIVSEGIEHDFVEYAAPGAEEPDLRVKGKQAARR